MPEIKRFCCWPSCLGRSTPIVGIDEFVKLIILLYMKSSNLSHSGTYLTKYLVHSFTRVSSCSVCMSFVRLGHHDG